MAVKQPESIAEFGRWLNEWGDEDKHPEYSRTEKDAYEDAISDAYAHFSRLFPDWHKKGRDLTRRADE